MNKNNEGKFVISDIPLLSFSMLGALKNNEEIFFLLQKILKNIYFENNAKINTIKGNKDTDIKSIKFPKLLCNITASIFSNMMHEMIIDFYSEVRRKIYENMKSEVVHIMDEVFYNLEKKYNKKF